MHALPSISLQMLAFGLVNALFLRLQLTHTWAQLPAEVVQSG